MSTSIPSLFKDVAFVMYPVSDMAAARGFYEGKLGLAQTANWEDKWIEYDIGSGTLAITMADEQHKPGAHGPTIALEVRDWPAVQEHLKAEAIPIVTGPFDSPVCSGCIIRDPDGNQVLLHAKK